VDSYGPPVGLPIPPGVRRNGQRRTCEYVGCGEQRTCLYYCHRHHLIICMHLREAPVPQDDPDAPK